MVCIDREPPAIPPSTSLSWTPVWKRRTCRLSRCALSLLPGSVCLSVCVTVFVNVCKSGCVCGCIYMHIQIVVKIYVVRHSTGPRHGNMGSQNKKCLK